MMNRVKNARGRNWRSRRRGEQVPLEIKEIPVVQVEAEEEEHRRLFHDLPMDLYPVVEAAMVLDDDKVVKGEDPDYLFVSDPPPDYLCQICMKVLREPHATECCGQHFCKACLEKWFSKSQKKKKVCPHCRAENFVHIGYKPLQRKINELKVFCSNRKVGCGVTMKLEKLNAHLSVRNPSGCGYVSIPCSNGCRQSILRSNIEHHMTRECVKRKVTCCHCHDKKTYDLLANHYKVCEEMRVSCLRDCGMQFRRGDVKKHEDECPNMQVKCPFFEAGCRIELTRKELDEHVEKGTTAHLMNFMASYNALKAENERLKTDVESSCNALKADNERLKTDFESSKADSRALKSQIAVEVQRINQVLGQTSSKTAASLECIESSLRGYHLDSANPTITFSVPPEVATWETPSFTVSPACYKLSITIEYIDYGEERMSMKLSGNIDKNVEPGNVLSKLEQSITVSLNQASDDVAYDGDGYCEPDELFSHVFTMTFLQHGCQDQEFQGSVCSDTDLFLKIKIMH